MPRGERIGDAYVRIHGDGSGLDKDIAKDFDEASKAIEDAGAKHSKSYQKGFADQLERDKGIERNIGRLAGHLQEGLGRFDAQSVLLFDDAFWKKIGDDWAKRFDQNARPGLESVSERMTRILRDGIRTGAIDGLEGLRDTFDNIRPIVERARQEVNAEWEKMLDEAERMNVQFDKDVAASRAALFQKWTEDQDRMFDNWTAGLHRQAQAEEAAYKDAVTRLRALRSEVDRNSKGMDLMGGSARGLRRDMDKLGRQIKNNTRFTKEQQTQFRRMRIQLALTHTGLARVNRQFGEMSDRIGDLTGRGSRNNFLNFIGSTNRNISRLFTTLTVGSAQALNQVFRLGGLLKDAFADPGLFKELAKNAFAFFSNFAANAVGLTVALGALIVTFGIFSALASGLLGIITALAASLSFALVGAIAAVVGALVPLAAGIGVVTAGFLSLSDAQKKALKADLKPLTNAFKDLGDAAADILFRDVAKWAKEAAPLIKDLTPAVEGVARSIRDVLGQALDELTRKGSGWDNFVDSINEFLPKATKRLGQSFSNIFGGLGGVFRAMLPLINRFLLWLRDITREFENWANSAKGQKELRDFFKDVGDSAAAVGDFIVAASEALGELFAQTKGTGDQFFRDMANAARDFTKWITSPEGKQSIEDWMDFAENLAEEIGDAVDAVVELVDELDTPANRKLLLQIINMFTRIVNATTNALREIRQFVRSVGALFATLARKFEDHKETIREWAATFREKFEQVKEKVENFGRAVREVFGDIKGKFDRLVEAARDVVAKWKERFDTAKTILSNLGQEIGRVKDKIVNLASQTVGNFGLPNPLRLAEEVWKAITDLFNLLRQAVPNFEIPGMSAARDLIQTVVSLLGSALDLAGRVASAIAAIPDIPGVPGRGQGEHDPGGAADIEKRTTTPRFGPTIYVTTPTTDPVAVARETINHLVAQGY